MKTQKSNSTSAKPLAGFNLTHVLAIFLFLLTLAACKKESTTPSTPSDQNFSGCKLISAGGSGVSYNLDGTISSFSGSPYVYSGNNLSITKNEFSEMGFTLNNKKFPIKGYLLDDGDSVLLNYTYNSSDYLSVLKLTSGAEQMEIRYEYFSGNLSKAYFYEVGYPAPLFTISYSYGTKLDSRKSFFERVMFFDSEDGIGFRAGKASNNLVHRYTYEEDGKIISYVMSYEFDAKGNVIKSTSTREGTTIISSKSYQYKCD